MRETSLKAGNAGSALLTVWIWHHWDLPVPGGWLWWLGWAIALLVFSAILFTLSERQP